MNQSDAVNEKNNEQAISGPGDLLQAARIQQGLTSEDVCARMHLSLGVLQSIEENDFDDITAPIFVKGYLRAYARLVSLNEDKMIQLYVDLYSNEDPPICTVSQIAPENTGHDVRIKWATYLVIFVLIALLSAWGWNKIQNKPEAVSLDVNQSSDTAATEQVAVEIEVIEVLVESDQAAVEVLNEFAGEFADEPSLESQLEQTLSADTVEESITEPASDETEAVVVEAEPITAVTNTAELDVTTDTIATEGTSTAVAKIKTTTDLRFDISRVAPAGIDLLNITVNADTWADIKDANNHRLVYDLLRANLNIQIRGKAPFNAFFGNGHGVEISFNSQSIDIASHTLDDNTARFEIGTN